MTTLREFLASDFVTTFDFKLTTFLLIKILFPFFKLAESYLLCFDFIKYAALLSLI